MPPIDADVSVGSGGKKEGAFSKARAREDLDDLIRGGFDVRARGAMTFLASRWDWPNNTTARWLREHRYLPPLPDKRERKPAERALNGNGRAHAV